MRNGADRNSVGVILPTQQRLIIAEGTQVSAWSVRSEATATDVGAGSCNA